MATGDNRTRNPIAKTTPMIMGESSSGDSATRSRFAQIHISLNKRLGDGAARYERMQRDKAHYYFIGRWLMENREAFAEAALEHLAQWKTSPTVRSQIRNDRVRHVYGTAYACMAAAGTMLGTITQSQQSEFWNFLIAHGEQGLQDVIEETFIAQFWNDVITMRRRGKVEPKFFSLKYVAVQTDGQLKEVPANNPDAIHVCYVGYDPVFQAYQSDKKARGEDVALGVGDMRRELEREPYWIGMPKGGGRSHRIRMGGAKTACWVINLERQAGEGKEEDRPFICPFAEELINVLSPEKQPDE